MSLHRLCLFLGFASFGLAQYAETCFNSNVCYRLNIPAETVSSGQGDIFLQMSAPVSYSWVAFGPGSGMTGSQMFIMYAASDTNVTVSPRLGIGEREPVYTSDTQISMLEGTGVENGIMTATFRCSQCHSWNGGSINFAADSAQWVYAARSGQALNSASFEATIAEHNAGHDHFDFSMTAAKGGNSLNPFASAAPPSSGDGVTVLTSSEPFPPAMLLAHAVLASLAMVVFFPLGSISLRVFSFPGLIWVHAGIQVFSLAIFTAAIGMGIYMAVVDDYIRENHAIIGLVVFGLLFFQPALGWLHHMGFVKHHRRTFWSHSHIWLGRLVITLGIINGGLGLLLTNNTSGGQIAYGVVAGIIWVAWVGASVFGEVKKGRDSNGTIGKAEAGHSSGELAR